MNFDLTEEQSLLHDSVERWVQHDYSFERRRALAATGTAFSAQHWRAFAEMGWLGLPFAEAHGGLGGSALDVALLMEAFGRGLVLEPYVPAILLFGGLVERSAALRGDRLPRVIAGEVIGSLAWLERDSRFELADVQTRVERDGDGWHLDGAKVLVPGGAVATQFVVSARLHGERFDPDGVVLLLVDADAPGVARTPITTMDGQRVAHLRFDGVRLPADRLLLPPGESFAALQAVVDAATLALCAEAVGIMSALLEATLDYVRTRKQFGVPIGSFQALQHRLVDMHGALEQTRSLLIRAVCAADERSPQARRCLHALKVMVGTAGRRIGGEAIQMHGGMGMTDELPIGHYVKRLMVIQTAFGDEHWHRRCFAALSSGSGAIG